MKRNNKTLYELIMRNVAKEVKHALNEWNIEDIRDKFDSDDNFTDNPDITLVYECPRGWKAINGCFILTGVNGFKDNRTPANRYKNNWTELPINWTTQYSLLEKDPYKNTNSNDIYLSDSYAHIITRVAKQNLGSVFISDNERLNGVKGRTYIKKFIDNYVRNYNNLPENIKYLADKYGYVDPSTRRFLNMYKQSKENIVFLYIIDSWDWDGQFIITHINNI